MQVVIHVGLPRTGTTFLQREIFPNLKGCNYMHKPPLWMIHSKPGKINIISDECLSGVTAYKVNFDGAFTTAYFLKKLFPHAKIIFTTRFIPDLFNSLYNQYNKDKRISYERWEKECTPGLAEFGFQLLKYFQYLQELFGTENVLFIGYATLEHNPHGLVRQICDFLGICMIPFNNHKWNCSRSRGQLWLTRQVRRVGRICMRL